MHLLIIFNHEVSVYTNHVGFASRQSALSLSVELLQARPLDRKLSPDIPVLRQLKLIHIATPDTTQTGPSCRVWCGGVN